MNVFVLSFLISPALEKFLSDETDIAGQHKYLLAITILLLTQYYNIEACLSMTDFSAY